MCLSSRLSAFQASKQLRDIMRVGMPRHTVLINRDGFDVQRMLASVPRAYHTAPDLWEYRAPVRMRQDAESEITVLITCSSEEQSTLMVDKVAAVADHMQTLHVQPTKVFRMLCISLTPLVANRLLMSLPATITASLHTLVLDSLETLVHIPPSMPPLLHTTTLDLTSCVVDMYDLGTAFPRATSLSLSSCELGRVQGLTAMTGLQTLRIQQHLSYPPLCDLPTLAAIEQLTWLSSVGLRGFGPSGCTALSGFTQLTSLEFSSDLSTGQISIATLARQSLHTGLLRCLRLVNLYNVLPVVTVPPEFGHLTVLKVSYNTPVPLLDSIHTLVIEDRDNMQFAMEKDLGPLPARLKDLRAPYNTLLRAVACADLEQVSWSSFAQGFSLSDHVCLLRHVYSGAWPVLERVLILHRPFEAYHLPQANQVFVEHEVFSSQLLQALCHSDRPIRHVTLHQSQFGPGLVMALCSKQLRSVTLMVMKVTVTDLERLVEIPTMQLLELVEVVGLTPAQLEDLRRINTGCRVQVLELSDLDKSLTWL